MKRPAELRASSPGKKPKGTAEASAVSGSSEADAGAAYLLLHGITVHEEGLPPPCLSLAAAPFPPQLVSLLLKQGFATPSPVQAATWPIAADGRDVLAIAKTGSGKTLGFLLPVMARCLRERIALAAKGGGSSGHPLALIMAPTRELGLQIAAEAAKFGKAVGCRAVAVYGGAKKDKQVKALQAGCEMIVGTPGRIADVLDTKGGNNGKHKPCCSVSSLCMLVLDEADRMLDMGFEKSIRDIAWNCFGGERQRAKQVFLYSATWPPEVAEVAAAIMSENAVKVSVGSGDRKLTASKSVTQRVHVVADAAARWAAFVSLIEPFGPRGSHGGKRVIVFANMKSTVKKVTTYCQGRGMAVECISGDRSQSQRESTLRRFKDGSVSVVIATDVAARGLDVKGIDRVINYELPGEDFHDYVHRIGRTGRAGATGEADSLFGDADRRHAPELVRIMKEAGQEVPPALAKLVSSRIVFDSDSD